MPVYSYSRIGCFENCPRQYKFKYIEKPPIEKVTGIEAFMGTMVHETLEKCYRMVMSERVPDEEELIAIYKRGWSESIPDNLRIVDSELTGDDYCRMGEKALRRFHQRHFPFDDELTIGLEKNIIFSLDEEGRFKMQGYIDRLSRDSSGRLRVQDYKTGGRLPTQEEIESDTQLALYQVAVDEMWPDNNGIELVWHYVRFDTSLVSHRSSEELDNLCLEYIKKIKRIEKAVGLDDFPVNETRLCDWCEYNSICPAKVDINSKDGEMQTELSLSGAENQKKSVDQYISNEARIKSLSEDQKRLKEKLLELGHEGRDIYIDGSGDKGVLISIRKTEKLPTKSADSRKFGIINDVIYDRGLYDKYSLLDIRKVQKAFDNFDFPEEVQERLAELTEKTTKASIKIK
ncbi:MAG: PD-(D/E)XK nuclease family protein [candidate division Zixibacteria bacterium]